MLFAWMDKTTFMRNGLMTLFPFVIFRTGHPVQLFLDKALGHSTEFTRENVIVIFSTKC